MLGGIYAARADTWEAGFFAPLRTHARQIAMLGLLGYVIYQVSFIVGVNHTTAESAALIMAASLLWTAMFSRVADCERLGNGAWAGLVISPVGTELVVIAGAEAAALSGSLAGSQSTTA